MSDEIHVNADGVVLGKPIDITADESFSVQINIPPLHRPDFEALLETLQVKDKGGNVVQTVYTASLAQSEVKIGGVSVVLKKMNAMSEIKGEARTKLGRLVGHAVAQAYVDLLNSDDPERVAAARSMEIGS